jgi:flagellar basal body-associated protein FliL
MLPSKKADMSLQVIIVAVIGIVVLVVLVMMFSSKARSFGTATTSCVAKGGHCTADCASNEIEHYGTDCAARAKDGLEDATAKRCCAAFYETEKKTETPPPAAPPATP